MNNAQFNRSRARYVFISKQLVTKRTYLANPNAALPAGLYYDEALVSGGRGRTFEKGATAPRNQSFPSVFAAPLADRMAA